MERLPAVKNKRIYCIANDYATVPGPRILLLLDDLKRIIADTEGVTKDNR
jgi:ABC-type Fe3+-hydroxamate transport system substrate-binding protein